MKITYIYASRSRPDKFFAALDNIFSLSFLHNFEIIAALDYDDPIMNNDEVRERLLWYHPKVKPYYGISTGKVNAINREIGNISKDTSIVCCHSDDMVFIKRNYDLDIIEAFKNFSGLVHFPDQVKRKLCTYAMLSKDYLDLDGWIYHPKFISVYCDDFQQQLAIKRGRYKFVDKKILEHRHHFWGFGPQDELSKQTDSMMVYAEDSATLNELKNDSSYITVATTY